MIAAELKFPNLAARLKAATKQIGDEMIVAIQTNRGMLFDAEGAYNGHAAWDPLVLRSGQVLANRGVLKKSIAPGNGNGQAGPGGIAKMSDDGLVTVGTDLAYARLMNFGTTKMPDGIMRPTHAKALRIPIPGGKAATDTAKELRAAKGTRQGTNPRTGKSEAFIFRKWVRIPERRFDTITAQDQAEFAAALGAVVAEVMRHG